MIKIYYPKFGIIEVPESNCLVKNFIEYSIYFRDYLNNIQEDYIHQPHHRIVKLVKYKHRWYLYYPLNQTSPCTGSFKSKKQATQWFINNGR